MAVSRAQFEKSLIELGIVERAEITAAEQRVPTELRNDPQALARELIVAGHLTKFQALNALQGRTKGLVFGEYLVLDRIGAGGMGQVFKARHRRMDRIVALKVMSGAAMKNADSVKRFQREVKAAAKLTHPNVVHAYDAGEQDGVPFLVMEFVDGADLSTLLKQQVKFAAQQACDYVAQAARGLAFAHDQGVIHRDIKPANLLVGRDGVVKILDLGLARFDDGSGNSAKSELELTQSGAVMGTVDYMAPEQAVNTRHADARSDVYSLGCTLYRLLTGDTPFQGDTLVEKILAHRDRPVPAVRAVRPDVPPAVEALVARMLAKQPDQRPTMQEIADVLGALDHGAASESGIGLARSPSASGIVRAKAVKAPLATVVAAETSTVAERTVVATRAVGAKTAPPAAGPPRRRSNRTLLVTAACGVVVSVAIGIWVLVESGDGDPVPVAGGDSVAVSNAPTTAVAIREPTTSTTGASAGSPTQATAVARTDGSRPSEPIGFNLPPTAVAVPSAAKPQVAPHTDAAGSSTAVAADTPIAAPFASDDRYVYFDAFSPVGDPQIVFNTLRYDGRTPLTLEAWCIPRPVPSMVEAARADQSQSPSSTAFGFHIGVAGETKLRMQWRIRGSDLSKRNWKLLVHYVDAPLNAGQSTGGDIELGENSSEAPRHAAVTVAPLPNGLYTVEAWLDGRRAYSGEHAVKFDPAAPLGSRGFISEMRVSKVVRYTKEFMPTKRFEPDADTLALYHCDEGAGDKLIDSTGNNHHGAMTDAKWAPIGSIAGANLLAGGGSAGEQVPTQVAVTPTATPPVPTPLDPMPTEPTKPVATPVSPEPSSPTKQLDADDPIARRLATAKAAYDREIEAIRKTVVDALDRRETTARRQSDKALVDQILLERAAYEKNQTLPPTLWATLDPRLEAARRTLLTAYDVALRDFVRGGKDAAADLVQAEMEAFRKSVGIIAKLAPTPPPRLSPKELLDLNREVAVWAIAHKARVVVVSPTGQTAELTGQLPTIPFGIKEIHLSDATVGDADIDKIALLPTLTHLDLRGTGVTDDGVVKLAGAGLKFLNLHDRKITDRGMAAVATMRNLEYLDIGWARISDAGLDAVAELPNLRSINLFAASVTDEGLRKLVRLRNLKSLELKNPKISPTTIQYLESMISGLKVAR